MTLTLNYLLAAVLTTGIGVVMTRLGVRKGALAERSVRRCASCGQRLEHRVCPHCTQR